ncbi:MAG: ATP:cob(I)alamin adenosyltransferase [Candidatus Roizmanbacteria bacterium]|nr:ATP:cob(I)alamin adenosyltransferase [Candidatus Roizmanbacteria bacterium]
MKVTTKKGDAGVTTLFNRARVDKSEPTIGLLGENDEIQSLLGILKTMRTESKEKDILTTIQKNIYRIMGELSGASLIPEHEIQKWTNELELEDEKIMKQTPIENSFIIPGENEIEAWCQFVRTKVRSLERSYCSFAKTNRNIEKFIPFFNRLSDYLFILGRKYATHHEI